MNCGLAGMPCFCSWRHQRVHRPAAWRAARIPRASTISAMLNSKQPAAATAQAVQPIARGVETVVAASPMRSARRPRRAKPRYARAPPAAGWARRRVEAAVDVDPNSRMAWQRHARRRAARRYVASAHVPTTLPRSRPGFRPQAGKPGVARAAPGGKSAWRFSRRRILQPRSALMMIYVSLNPGRDQRDGAVRYLAGGYTSVQAFRRIRPRRPASGIADRIGAIAPRCCLIWIRLSALSWNARRSV